MLESSGSCWIPVSKIPSELPETQTIRKHKERLYLTEKSIEEMEIRCANNVIRRMQPVVCDFAKVERGITFYENKNHIQLSEEQKEAIRMFCSEKLCILTGGPGTGKTAVIKAAALMLSALDVHCTFSFLAPTGKSAKRMMESIGKEARTVHAELEENEVIYNDIVFLDEASMIDLETFDRLMLALSPITRLYIIGDVDQLPSVGIGAVLRDLTDSGIIPTVNLKTTFRQNEESVLFENIQIIRKGGFLPLTNGDDFKIINAEREKEKYLIHEYMNGIKEFGVGNCVLLSSTRKAGILCSDRLNEKLQKKVNPQKGVRVMVRREGLDKQIEFREGDPVIHLRNVNGLANGETGIVRSVTDREITVEYEDCFYTYDTNSGDLNDLDLAYALSINKSQGSEYPCVITFFERENKNLSRNIIYTAITRAKRKCVVIADDETIRKNCKVQSAWDRTTFLCEELLLAYKTSEIIKEVLS